MNLLKRCLFLSVVVAAVLALSIRSASAQDATPDPSQYQWVRVVDGLDMPLNLAYPKDGTGRLFEVEQAGGIYVISKDGRLSDDPFLDITNLVTDDVSRGGYTERGLIGMAFHPDYSKNGLFFIHYIDKDNNTVIARYKVSASDPNKADPSSAVIILKVQQPDFENHKGGQLAFGPDGYMYIGLGDGGSLGDPMGNAQNTKTLLGKILRIDVDADTYKIPPTNPFVGNADYLPEIWAYGFRNPYRFSFDRLTGDLYIGDVGENKFEEVDYQPANDKGGENYGWNLWEGFERFKTDPAQSPPTVPPVAVYDHSQGCAVMGGYDYRGKALPSLNGVYFYGDYCNGNVWTLIRDSSGNWKSSLFAATGHQISSFGEDESGELYFVDYKGSVWKLVAK